LGLCLVVCTLVRQRFAMQASRSFVTAAFAALCCCQSEPAAHTFGASGGTPSPIIPASWTVPTWFVDPSAGSDNNSCTSIGAPCKSYAAIVQRWGTTQPTLLQSTAITWLNDDVSTDPVVLLPTLVGGGGLSLNGSLIQITTATIGTYTAPNFVAGTKGQITASGQSGAYWTPFVGMIVRDTTNSSSFVVDSDIGSATATISTPFHFPVQEFPASPGTITNGDAITIFRPTKIFLLFFDSVGLGNLSGGGFRALNLNIASEYSTTFGPLLFVTESQLTSSTIFTSMAGSSVSPVFTGCFISSTVEGAVTVVGGSMSAVGNNFQNGSSLDGDVLINQRIHYGSGLINFRRVYFGQTNAVDSPVVNINVVQSVMTDNGSSARVWGPGGLNVFSGMHFDLHFGSAVSTLLLTGTLQIDNSVTGYPWLSGSHAFGAGLTVTPTNIDANGNLQNPAFGSIIAVE
jgi:hypothetical protein